MSLLPQLAVLAVATALTVIAGFALDVPWVLPVLNALPAYVLLAAQVRLGRRAEAVAIMLGWSVCLATTTIAMTFWWPARAESVVLNGTAYRDEMIAWLSSGVGRESDPSQFIPQHLMHAGVFSALSLATASVASLIMGAMLMNYMSFYVGDLILRCWQTPSWLAAIALAWNPWSMVRVASFIVLGVVLAEPVLSRLPGASPPAPGRARWLAVGAGGLALDMVLKAALAPLWPRLLGGCLAG